METTTATSSKKPIYKKWWFWVLAIILIGIIGSAGSKSGKGSGNSGSSSSSTEASDGLTMAAFNRITDGMRKSEVDKLAGSSGEIQVSAGSGSNQMESYKYEGTDGSMSFALVSFTGGSESGKTQVGLK
jgi:hypothetical protein